MTYEASRSGGERPRPPPPDLKPTGTAVAAEGQRQLGWMLDGMGALWPLGEVGGGGRSDGRTDATGATAIEASSAM